MAAVDILVPSPLSFNPDMYSSDSTAALFRIYSAAERDYGYSSPDEAPAERAVAYSPPPPPATVMTADEHNGERDDSEEDSAALLEKVRKQVEWYFSDENLQKDSFLMKHITRNKQGYVSLKLVASLRKVKSITKDWKIVLTAVEESSLLQVNEEKTKIRRTEAAPKVDYSHLPKTLLVTNYPHIDPDETDIRNEFGRHGNVTSVLVLHPGKAIPLDVKSCRSKFPAIGKETCILIEYATVREARQVLKELSQNWRQTMIVQILSADSAAVDNNASKNGTVESPKTRQQKPALEPAVTRNSKVSPTVRKTARHRTPGSGYDSGYTASRSPSLSPMPSPAPSRKFFSEPSSNVSSSHSRLSLVRSTTIPVSVIRSPHGPDGSLGFH